MKRISFMMFVLAFLSIFTFVSMELSAQGLEFPKPSPKATVTQAVGLTDITITYHRPGVKGRVIWGNIVPYDQVWRTGANNATTIMFSKEVSIEGTKIAAGTYGLFTIPGQEEWTVIISKQADIWGSMGYKQEQDVLRFKVKPTPSPDCETMLFCFADVKDDSAKIVFRWEKIMFSFTVTVDTKAMLLGTIEKTMDRYWTSPYQAAEYAYDSKMFDKAKAWINISISIKENYWNMLLKAKIFKDLAKTKIETAEAIKILERANTLIKDLPQSSQGYATEGPELLKTWTKKQ